MTDTLGVSSAAPSDPSVASPAVKPWYDGADAELVGHLQNHGWHNMDVGKAALAAAQSHREAAKLIGVPPDQVLRIAKPEDAVGTAAMWGRLGRPQDAKGYDLTGVKFADGTELDAGFVEHFTKSAFGLNIPKDQAAGMAQAFVKFMEGTEATEAAETAALLAGEKQTLAKNWGPNHVANMTVAQNAARALGITPEEVQALENTVGYAKVMEMFRNIGSKIGEDKFVRGDNPAGNGVMTREQAVANKGELMHDQNWVKRYMDGGAAERRQMEALLRIITGETGDYGPA